MLKRFLFKVLSVDFRTTQKRTFGLLTHQCKIIVNDFSFAFSNRSTIKRPLQITRIKNVKLVPTYLFETIF